MMLICHGGEVMTVPLVSRRNPQIANIPIGTLLDVNFVAGSPDKCRRTPAVTVTTLKTSIGTITFPDFPSGKSFASLATPWNSAPPVIPRVLAKSAF